MKSAEKLAFATVLLLTDRKDGSRYAGTGFLIYLSSIKTNRKRLVLITNKHVVEDTMRLNLVFSLEVEGKYTHNTQEVDLSGATKWINHPNPKIDLCCLDITEIKRIVEEKDKVKWFISPLDANQIAQKDDLADYAPADEVYMIGYPDGLRDKHNNQPMFRRGVFAGIPAMDYDGEEQFVVDMAVYPGSSGSPVVTIKGGVYVDGEVPYVVDKRYGDVKLVGIVTKTFLHGVKGDICIVPVANLFASYSQIPNSLGIVIKAYLIHDFEALL